MRDVNIGNRFLFNFAVSYTGGGYKRLYEYAKWFAANGGAWFIVHPNCGSLLTEFPSNRYFVVKQSRLERIREDCRYLAAIGAEIGKPEFYYAYGIPIYYPFGNINWFHLSNVLPLAVSGIPVSPFDRLRLGILGRRIRLALVNADVISAESNYSLGLLNDKRAARLFLSVNGSNDEIDYIQRASAERKDDIATVVGTNSHKAIEDSFRVFEMLKRDHERLKLMIIGNAKDVPRGLRRERSVVVRGLLARAEVVNCLKRSKYYISTTLIENSYNAASEGIFIADESYISDIGPHRELLMNMHYDEVLVPMLGRRLLHVRRSDLFGGNLKTWTTVIDEMIERFRDVSQSLERGARTERGAGSSALDLQKRKPR
jgi:glycosyltransferase involved in cell wall biosynthesis